MRVSNGTPSFRHSCSAPPPPLPPSRRPFANFKRQQKKTLPERNSRVSVRYVSCSPPIGHWTARDWGQRPFIVWVSPLHWGRQYLLPQPPD